MSMPQQSQTKPGITWANASTRSVDVSGTKFVYRQLGADNGSTPNSVAAMAHDAVAFIRALGLEQVDLLGFSLGGFISQVIAQEEPPLVRKVILAGTGPASTVVGTRREGGCQAAKAAALFETHLAKPWRTGQITGHLRCFSNQPVAEIVQCGEPFPKKSAHFRQRVEGRPTRCPFLAPFDKKVRFLDALARAPNKRIARARAPNTRSPQRDDRARPCVPCSASREAPHRTRLSRNKPDRRRESDRQPHERASEPTEMINSSISCCGATTGWRKQRSLVRRILITRLLQ
jgi:pimeloyl-ACP methyl ester carboxylesterase